MASHDRAISLVYQEGMLMNLTFQGTLTVTVKVSRDSKRGLFKGSMGLGCRLLCVIGVQGFPNEATLRGSGFVGLTLLPGKVPELWDLSSSRLLQGFWV